MAMSSISTCVALLICISIAARADAQSLLHLATGSTVALEEEKAVRQPARELPFNPLSSVPPPGWDGRPDRRWWATMVVEGIVAAGFLASDRLVPATDATEQFLRHLELSFDVPRVLDRPDDRWRLRFRLKVKHARPTAGLVLNW